MTIDIFALNDDALLMLPKPPRAPSGLKSAGRALWKSIIASFDLRPDELATLTAACRCADDLARLTEALDAAPVMVKGSKAQKILNPLFAECRQQRLALSRLLLSLGLEDSESIAAGMARSAAGRKLAMTRWAKRGA